MGSEKVKQVSGDTGAEILHATSAECRFTTPSLAMMEASNNAVGRETTRQSARAQRPGAVAVRGMRDASTVGGGSDDEHLTTASSTRAPHHPASPNVRPITARLVSVSQDVSPQELERLRRDQMAAVSVKMSLLQSSFIIKMRRLCVT